MFGYLTVDRGELKGKDLERYQMYYCGVCRDLKDRCGEKARLTLTYDMTFLAILLTSLYEGNAVPEKFRCVLHPDLRRNGGRYMIRNEYTAYAADMNLIMSYHDIEDDWEDERNPLAYASARSLRNPYLKAASRWPQKTRAVRLYLRKLHEAEYKKSGSIDLASGLTGDLFSEIFMYRDDFWRDDIRRLGFCIGKFIYLMDAWDDLDKDRKSGSYNPFLTIADDPDYSEKAAGILTMQAAEASRAFERLPLFEDVDILRNILYCGIWVRYRQKNEASKEDPGR